MTPAQPTIPRTTDEEQAFVTQTARAIAERDSFLQALRRIAKPVPSMKGMNPTERANRMRRLLEERRMTAVDAMREANYP